MSYYSKLIHQVVSYSPTKLAVLHFDRSMPTLPYTQITITYAYIVCCCVCEHKVETAKWNNEKSDFYWFIRSEQVVIIHSSWSLFFVSNKSIYLSYISKIHSYTDLRSHEASYKQRSNSVLCSWWFIDYSVEKRMIDSKFEWICFQ